MANLDPNARFERQRLLAKQEQNQANQQASEAMQRRLAAQGRLNSGSAIKGEQKIQNAGNQVLTKRLGEIQDAQEGEQLRKQEIEEGRKFTTAEREASQAFGADQARLSREFTTSERLGGQDFSEKLMGKQQAFATSERLAGQDFASNEAGKNRAFSTSERKASELYQHEQNSLQRGFQAMMQNEQLKQQLDMFNKQFALDEEVTRFNMDMAKSEANKKDIFQRFGDVWTNVYKGFAGIGKAGSGSGGLVM